MKVKITLEVDHDIADNILQIAAVLNDIDDVPDAEKLISAVHSLFACCNGLHESLTDFVDKDSETYRFYERHWGEQSEV